MTAGAIAALVVAAALIHTAPVKDAVRTYAVRALDERLGGSASIERLDYRLWRGEIRAFGVEWSSNDATISIRADEVELGLSSWAVSSVTALSPRVDVRPADDATEAGAMVRLPSELFTVAVSATDGRLSFNDSSLDNVELRVEPDDGFWVGTVSTGPGSLGGDAVIPGVDSARARVHIGPESATLTEIRIENDDSYVTGTVRVDSFAPWVVDASLTHSIENSLWEAQLPDATSRGPIVGDVSVRRQDDAWSARGTFDVEAFAYAPIELDRATVPWRFDGDVVRIENAALTGRGGTASVSASFDLREDTQAAEISFIDVEVDPRLASRARGEASVSLRRWDLAGASGRAELELRTNAASTGVPLEGRIGIDLAGETASIRARRLQGPGFELDARGDVGQTLDLEYTVRVADVAALGLAPAALELEGSGSVEGRVGGTLSEPRLTASVSTSDFSLSGVPLAVAAALTWEGSLVELASLSIEHASGGALSLSGLYDLDAETLALRGEGDELSIDEIPELEATISSLHVDVRGGLRSLTGLVTAEIDDVKFRGVALPRSSVVVEADGNGAHLSASANGEIWVEGRVDASAAFPAEIELQLGRLPLADLLRTFPDYADVELRLDGRLLASGNASELASFRYRLEAEQVVGSYRGVGFGVSSPFVLDGNLQTVTVHDLTLIGADTAIGIEGELPLTAEHPLDLHARGVARLELLSLWLPDAGLEGRADMEIRAIGPLRDPALRGDIRVSDARATTEGFSVEGVDARARLEGASIVLDEITGDVFGGRFSIDGELPFREGADAEARLRFRLEDAAPVTFPESDLTMALRLSASGEVVGGSAFEPTRWRGSGAIEDIRASVGSLELTSASGASTWMLDDGLIRVSELRLSGVDTDVAISGEARPFSDPIEWDARASGRLDARFLGPALADLGVALTGETEFRVNASQGLEPLVVGGAVTLTNGRLSVREPAIAFTNLTGNVELEGRTLKLTALDANVGGGTFHAEGVAEIGESEVSLVDVRGRARSVRMSYPEGMRSEIDGTIRMLGPLSDLELTGDVTLARAIFSRNINLQSELLESLSRASTLTPTDSFTSSIGLDVRIRTREGLRIDNNLATMDASTNLVLGGTVAEPEIGGVIAAREGGEFRFGRNAYRIQSGQIILQRYPVEPPELDIIARTTVGEHDIRMTVRGPADNLVTEVSGTSRRDGTALTPPDAASLLVTGRTIENVSTQGRTILGEQMASYLGSSLGDLAQFGLGGALPFDIVTVEPALIAGEADPSARFTLGAALTESLSVVYSIGLNDAEKQIWIVDYELPRRTRTQVIRQVDNEFTFAFGQQLQLDPGSGAREREPQAHVSRLGFYFVSSEPGELEDRARERLGVDLGDRYEYWKAWERAEALRDWLRELGFLEATVDLAPTLCGAGCVELDVGVVTGKRVRFEWTGDELESSLKSSLVAVWDGYMTPAFLASDMASRARALLFERRYYLADVDVELEERPEETLVTIRIVRGPRGARVAVDFRGNEAVGDEVLLAALPKRSSTEFYELITTRGPRLKQVLDVSYASLGYLQAEIGDPETSFDVESGVFRVIIPVDEGEPSIVGRVELEGVEGIPVETVRRQIGLTTGEPLRLTRFVQGRSALAAFYRRQGFADAEVDSAILPGDAPGSLVARYVVREGPETTVRNIRVAGNDVTRESVIRREVALESGEPLRLTDVSRTQKRLYELGIFRSADVVVSKPEGEDGNGVRDVVVEVDEAPDVVVDYGVRYTTDGLFQVVADVRAPNLFGRAQRAGLRTLWGTDERIFRFTYGTPYLVRYKLTTDFFVERRVKDENDELVPFTERDWTFTAQQTRPLDERLALQWSYSFKQTDIVFDDPFSGPITLGQNQSVFTTALIGDYRNGVVSPSSGSLWSVTLQGAPQFFGSDFKFVKLFGQAYTFVDLGGGVVWAAGYRAGAINNLGQFLLEDDRFQAGGPNSIRGFPQNSLGPALGGEAVMIFNQEIRFPIAWRLRGVGFYDTGNAFATPSELSFTDLRHSAGVGVRLVLPFGLIRFDWARILGVREGEDPWRFVFSLGHAF